MWQIVFCSHRALSRLLTHMRHGIPFPFSCLLLCSLPSCHDRAAASAIREVGGGFRTVYDDCATTTKKKAMAMATTMAMSPHCLTQFRLMADKLSARYVLSNSPRPPAQIVYDAFELCFKKKSQKKTRNRRDVIARDDPPSEKSLTARGDKWGQMWEVRNVSIVKINYCGFLSS